MEVSELKLSETSVEIGLQVSDAQQAIEVLGTRLVEAGCVRPEYIQDVIHREQEFPTGLPTAIPIAIPHASSGNCITTSLAIGLLKQPVSFVEMGSPGRRLDVEMVFLLAIKNVEEQTTWLRNLMKIFKDKEFLQRLRDCGDRQTAAQMMAGALKG